MHYDTHWLMLVSEQDRLEVSFLILDNCITLISVFFLIIMKRKSEREMDMHVVHFLLAFLASGAVYIEGLF